jgi:hypothetical protein
MALHTNKRPGAAATASEPRSSALPAKEDQMNSLSDNTDAGSGAISEHVTEAAAIGSEYPVDKVTRLSQELAEALNEYGEGRWGAEIVPSDSADYPAMLYDMEVRKQARRRVDPKIIQLIEEHKKARIALDNAADDIDEVLRGRPPSERALTRWNRAERKERRLLNAVYGFPAHNNATRRAQAKYLLSFNLKFECQAEHLQILLATMASSGEGD